MNSVEVIIGGGQGMLDREVYYFYLENQYHLWLDYYVIQSRLTTRHEWRNEKFYNRFNCNSQIKGFEEIKEEDVNLTENIKEMALKQLLSQIKVQKWSERK